MQAGVKAIIVQRLLAVAPGILHLPCDLAVEAVGVGRSRAQPDHDGNRRRRGVRGGPSRLPSTRHARPGSSRSLKSTTPTREPPTVNAAQPLSLRRRHVRRVYNRADVAAAAVPASEPRAPSDCGTRHNYHDPASLYPTACGATPDNRQAHLLPRSRRHDKWAFITKAWGNEVTRSGHRWNNRGAGNSQ
jgi:hypothetical protein